MEYNSRKCEIVLSNENSGKSFSFLGWITNSIFPSENKKVLHLKIPFEEGRGKFTPEISEYREFLRRNEKVKLTYKDKEFYVKTIGNSSYSVVADAGIFNVKNVVENFTVHLDI